MSEPIGIDLRNDYAFKRVFGDPQWSETTIDFLNAVLSDRAGTNEVYSPIVSVEYLNPTIDPADIADKTLVLDVRVCDDRGRHANVEMQVEHHRGFVGRAAYYNSAMFSQQLKSGEGYDQLAGAITIGVLDFELFPTEPRLHTEFRWRECAAGFELTDLQQIHFLELPKCRATRENLRGASPLEQWAFLLRHANRLSVAEIGALFPGTAQRRVGEVLQMISRTDEERIWYESREKGLRDYESRLADAEARGIALGRAVGLAEGESRGIAMGEARGEARGRAEGTLIGRIQTLQNILNQREQSIDEFAGLDLAELQRRLDELQQELRNR